MAAVSEPTFNALKDMGIDPVLAREAALRYHNIEPAVNWCFGDGQSWTPPAAAPEPVSAYNGFTPQFAEGTSVEHREVADVYTPPVTRPTSPVSRPLPQLASNNPFRQSPLHPPSHSPSRTVPALPPRRQPAPSPAPMEVDDEEEELQKAMAISQGGHSSDQPEDERNDRERSIRADGPPPPSPNGDAPASQADPIESIGPLFGPTNKTDEEGNMAMVPSSGGQEDEELDRAIQESLMTASFHSASAMKDADKPKPVVRAEGTPLVFFSQSARSTYAANFLQAMYAVPQLREAVHAAMNDEGRSMSTEKANIFKRLYQSTTTQTDSFIEVDDELKTLRDGREPGQLPPTAPTLEFHNNVASEIASLIAPPERAADGLGADDSRRLFQTEVDGEPPRSSSFVTFMRSAGLPCDVHSQLASILWDADSPGQGLVEVGDILTVFIDWQRMAPREVWKLEERVTLDRYMKDNAAWAAQRRAHQSVMAGNARRVQEKIDRLTMHEGNDYQQSLKSHLETSPPTGDPMQEESRQEMKDKLAKILSALQARVAEYKVELEENQRAASVGAFEVDDSAFNRHKFVLRGVLFTDGALVGGNHLFAYVRNDSGQWWRVQEHEAKQVEWNSIVADKTGLWMDGGPYMLVYSREGPRPDAEPAAAAVPHPTVAAHADNLIDVDMSEGTPTAAPVPSAAGNSDVGVTSKQDPAVDDLILL
ncbi:hypothetical protein IAU60_002553 [Kwoniella sp. DSM 27419]